MGLRLVNMFPSSPSDYTKPGKPLQFGLKSESSSVEEGSISINYGFTSIDNEGLLPEADPNLPDRGATVTLTTPERILPAVPGFTSMVGSTLTITRESSNNERSVYEIQMPVANKTDSVMAYFKLKKRAWAVAARAWCNLSQMTPVYIGLENGIFNNALYVFLRGAGTGSVVFGGPTQTDQSRPMQQEVALPWKALVDGSSIEFWVVYNNVGYGPPFTPDYVPMVELWARIDPTAMPTLLTVLGVNTLPVDSLLPFPPPSTFAFNSRLPTDTTTIYLGNGGSTGDVVEFMDWAFYPDYRIAVVEGVPRGNSLLSILPDSPVSLVPSDGVPLSAQPGLWVPALGGAPQAAPIFQLGHPGAPYAMELTKHLDGQLAFQKIEPRIASLAKGMMIEGRLYGEQTVVDGDIFGAGFALHDTLDKFGMALIATPTNTTVGLIKDSAQSPNLAGYYLPLDGDGNILDVDWSSPKLYRVLVDREVHPNTVSLLVDEVEIIKKNISDLAAFPDTEGRALFGFLANNLSRGALDIGFLRYCPRYQGWGMEQGVQPDGLPSPFTKVSDGTNSVTEDSDSELVLAKGDFGVAATALTYSRNEDLEPYKGIQVDFSTRILSYSDGDGATFARGCWLGCGVTLYLSEFKLHLGFFDCGPYGRRVGIIPGSGSIDDILNLTNLGSQFSAQVDWTQPTLYRLVYKAFDSIKVYIGDVVTEPSIVIPWTGAFDLPIDSTTPGVAFGHFDSQASSTSAWKYFRYGISNGFEAALTPLFPNGIPSYAFGGRVSIQMGFDE